MILEIVKANATTTPSGFIRIVPGINTTILRNTCLDIQTFNRDLHNLTQSMIETMFAANGVGLAAPQIGANLNLFVMRTEAGLKNGTSVPNEGDALVIVNPKYVLTGETYKDVEGCLSIPGLLGRVERYKELACAYVDTEGVPRTCALSAYAARIAQHEYDHLNGVLFVDRADKFYQPASK